MKTVVMGGGVVGVTTAYYLAKRGHEVVVLDAQDELATQATAGNAGLIAPGHSFAWASPAAPSMLFRSLLGRETAIRVKLRPDARLAAWGMKFLRECTAERAQRNTLNKLRLAQYSQKSMNELAAEEGLQYHQVNKGVFYLYRDAAELELGAKKMKLLWDHGQKQDVLDSNEVARLEPALEPVKSQFAGAIYGVTDASGDSALFTRNLAKICEGMGTSFRLRTFIRGLTSEDDRITGVVTDQGIVRGDNYVLSLGIDSPKVAKSVGVRLPIYPAKGYSVTLPIREGNTPPVIGGVDEGTLVAWCRIGDYFRLTSTAEFAGYRRTWKPSDFSNIFRMAQDLFPNAADYSEGTYRACMRPMTPDGPAIIGKGPHRNLYYNTGHGHMGWTMACGSSRAITDVIEGVTPELDLTGHEFRY